MWEEEDGQQRYTSCPTACRCEVRFPEQSMHDLSTPLASRLHARIDLTPFPIGTRLRHLRRAKADRYSLHGVLALLWPHAECMRWLGASAAHGSALQPLRWAARGRGLPALPRRARRARGRATAARGGAAAAGRGRGASPMAGHAHRALPRGNAPCALVVLVRGHAQSDRSLAGPRYRACDAPAQALRRRTGRTCQKCDCTGSADVNL